MIAQGVPGPVGAGLGAAARVLRLSPGSRGCPVHWPLSCPPPPAAYTLARVYGVEDDLSEVARRGSGSACRSLHGGFVEWQMGEQADGKDSVARQVAPESHWPQLRVLVLVVSGLGHGQQLARCAVVRLA